ncbi:AAA family ATPase [Vogesella oryzae]|uniref:AAA family ATPase n=1 Tax=Vogesella oryzae TaxID=1735285 RepID=UPI0015817B05|nr:AAA family ATPase [Vogesella oryzae]
MDSFEISNLKSFKNTGKIKIKPITIFVGENSSGKSSILRSIPLFKQSMEEKTLGSILWSGKYVDFGTFTESLNMLAHKEDSVDNKEISFKFDYKTTSIQRRRSQKESKEVIPVSLTISVSEEEYDSKSYTLLTIKIHNNVISIKTRPNSKPEEIIINSHNFTKEILENYVFFKDFSVIPSARRYYQMERENRNVVASMLMSKIKEITHHRTSEKTIENIAQYFKYDSDHVLLRQLKSSYLTGVHGAHVTSTWNPETERFKAIKNLVIANNLADILDSVSHYFVMFFHESRYITPLRAAADRYYRIKNISIDQLDPNGSNLAMYLNAMRPTDIEELNHWLKRELKFKIKIESTRGHASIFIVDENESITNIADNGFGFSQILPILIQVWHVTNSKNKRTAWMNIPTSIVIEQPELHLHPKMQSKVGEALCKTIEIAKNSGIDLRLLIETHSEQIINSIGRSIENKTITKDDAGIYLVEKKNFASIREAHYDEGGFLNNWPYGFFDGE